MPAADFCDAVRMNRSTLSPDSGTRHRSPEVSSTAFSAQPPDLPPAALMDLGFASFGPLARCRRPRHPVLVHRLAPLLHASFRPRLTTAPLRFAITSPPSGCEEDFHLQAVDHARHTTGEGMAGSRALSKANPHESCRVVAQFALPDPGKFVRCCHQKTNSASLVMLVPLRHAQAAHRIAFKVKLD